RSLRDYRRAMTPMGTLVIVGGPRGGALLGPLSRSLSALMVSPFVSQRLVPFLAHQEKADLVALKDLIETGKLTPAMDRSYQLSETPEAIRYVETGHARGKVVISV
ncbi:MAG: zinc-binding dehydrogenase, partial [Candidatus Dormibacteraeota bacterium]|nr:zinc-binding dehydrogenase [Candidatus Dormibacteraeota bacterium]